MWNYMDYQKFDFVLEMPAKIKINTKNNQTRAKENSLQYRDRRNSVIIIN